MKDNKLIDYLGLEIIDQEPKSKRIIKKKVNKRK